MTLTLTKTTMGRNESDLVAAARAGDDRSFEVLYARYRARIFSFILTRVHDHGRAEDIAQEVFIAALRRLRASDGDIAFKPWIYEIAKNACIDEFRRGARARETPLETDGEIVVDRGSIVGAVPSPPSVVEGRQRLDDLRGAFGGLSDSHRRLLLMREFEGLSYDEIGVRLEMNRQMVESSLFRARRKLAEEYQELESGRRCLQVQAAIDAGELQSARGLGLRSRRLFARHLSHCQPCRHVALMAGVDDALVQRRGIAAKVAALLPFGLGRWLLRRGGGGGSAPARAGAAAAHSAGPAMSLGSAAAGVAALAIAGAGAGILQGAGHGGQPTVRVAPTAAHVAAPAASRAATTGAASGATGRAGQAAGASGVATARPASFVLRSGTRTPAKPGARRPGSHRRHSGGSGTGGGSGSGSGRGAGGGTQSKTGSTAGIRPSRLHSGNVASTMRNLGEAVGSVLNGTGQAVSKTVSSATHALVKEVSTVSRTVSKTVQGTTNVVSGAASTVTPAVTGAGQAVSSATGALTGASQSAQPAGSPAAPAGSTPSGVPSAVSSVTAPLKSAVSQTTSGLLSH